MVTSLLLTLALLAPTGGANQAAHEYSDLIRINAIELYEEYLAQAPGTSEADMKELKELFRFRDFIGTALDGSKINHHLPSEPDYTPAKLLLLSYTAEWCENCAYEAPYLNELYEKYHSRGLEIVTRTEYSAVDKVHEFIKKHDMKYPVIIGSVVAYDERETVRMETFQYLLRKTVGDTRKWGTPFNIIIVDGDVENPYVVVGEMISDQVNKLIEDTLSEEE